MVKCSTTLVVLIHTYIQECVSATVSLDTTPTAKKKGQHLTECRGRVGPTLSTYRRRTQMTVVWGVYGSRQTQIPTFAAKNKSLVVRKNSHFCHWNKPRAISFWKTCTHGMYARYNKYTSLYATNFNRGGWNSKGMHAVVFDKNPHRHKIQRKII